MTKNSAKEVMKENQITEEELEQVSGAAHPKLSKCPKCQKQAMRIKFKRLECQNCGYVESFFK